MTSLPARAPGRWWCALLFVTALAACGCDSSAKVSGKVYYNGQLIKGGNVTFISQDGKPSVSTPINEDGTYTFAKAPTGKVKICVETESLNPKNRNAKTYSAPAGQKAPEGFEKTVDMSNRYARIPESYADAGKTTLTTEVKRGAQEYDIKLE